ncbi:hypothetical protein SNOG_05451 [Parastagonospora nodorum SN15]|uniref:Uncharacterized protein n=1 Tax=Phaeosphaeria nodorum (strain SN15 / ATCC MYA-4574 / FGSC 10173) TaxID=321614 RepID=Q0US13_PHANO|nr:hypothetical protein SNOG_05451 [Parastagonospora nodorum SN15]EAT87842.1 hypothetical protein SNOG_05451 [Parastagonospora nodorum SN15]
MAFRQSAVGDLCKLHIHDLRIRRNAFDGHVDVPASFGQLYSSSHSSSLDI